jgi:hypothetical protein
MLVGLVLISMIGSATVTALLIFYQYPLWIALLAYPCVGSFILLPGVALMAWIKRAGPEDQAPPDAQLTSRSHAAQPRPLPPVS